MKVVHVNTFDCTGGAARAAYRLHSGLRKSGLDSRMFVAEKISDDPSVLHYIPPADLKSRLGRRLRRELIVRSAGRYLDKAPSRLTNFSDDRTIYGVDAWRHLPEHDLIHLHWVTGFLDYRSFFASMPPNKPIVWTLHGMEVFTGGCFYDGGCGKFAQQCGACPELGSQSHSDLSRQVWRRKRENFANVQTNRLHIAAPCRWMRDQVTRSSLLSRFPCSVIPNGLDTDVFAPRDRRIAREVLGIPQHSKVILFAADGVHVPRKGFQMFVRSLADVPPESMPFLLSVGPGEPPDFGGLHQVHVGSIQNDRFLSFVYSAADVSVIPSLQDNLPNTMIESIACGVPVVGFAVGGIPDAVRPGVTGALARVGDVADLRSALLELLGSKERLNEFSVNCRRIALQEYSLETQARRYLAIYEELLGDDNA